MAYDKNEIEYWLTDNGWKLAGETDLNVIEKWIEKTYQGSGFGKESKQGDLIWANSDFNQEQREALHVEFPAPWSEEEQWRRNREFSRNVAGLLGTARNLH